MKSKVDPVQIWRSVFDEVKKALRVTITDSEMSMEINHKDGDSITAHPAKLSASSIGVTAEDKGKIVIPPLDCSSIRALRVDVIGKGNVKVMLSPVDSGDCWREGFPIEDDLIARRVMVVSDDAEGDVHLVGRS